MPGWETIATPVTNAPRASAAKKLAQYLAQHQVIKQQLSVYSRLRLILERRFKELDMIALKKNSTTIKKICISELSFTLNEIRVLELLIAKPNNGELLRKIGGLLRLKLLCTINTPLQTHNKQIIEGRWRPSLNSTPPQSELRYLITCVEREICGTTQISFSTKEGHCHNFVKKQTTSALHFLTAEIEWKEVLQAKYERSIFSLNIEANRESNRDNFAPVFAISEIF
jgi:hypothetical protein